MSCCICKKLYNPFLPRSFHRLPTNEERRKKWLTVIGHTVCKSALICSDHFTESDFHNENTMSKLRKLKNTAVPSISMQQERLHLHSENMEKEFMETEQLNENDQLINDSNSTITIFKLNPQTFIYYPGSST